MIVLWVIFFLGVSQLKVGLADPCEEKIHYLDKFTIESVSATSAKACSDSCRNNKLCSHWSWTAEVKTCQLKYIPRATKPQQSYHTIEGVTSGERFCGSLVSAVCPNQIHGQVSGGTEKLQSTNFTLEECISKCGRYHTNSLAKIYVTTQIAKNITRGNCYCELTNNDKLVDGRKGKYKTCTLPARGAPKSLSIDGDDTLTPGTEANFECNFDWNESNDEYLVPNVSFHLSQFKNNQIMVNKIQLKVVPKFKQLHLYCGVDNKREGKNVPKLVKVEWNEIKRISGNLFPKRKPNKGLVETYGCDVDANPSPKLDWKAYDRNGKELNLMDKREGKKITITLEPEIDILNLTCYSSSEGNLRLNTSKHIYITVKDIEESVDKSSESPLLSTPPIIGISVGGALIFISIFLIVHAVRTCRRYKACQPYDINIDYGTRQAPSTPRWILQHTCMYLSGEMLTKIADYDALKNAEVEQNSIYGYEDYDYGVIEMKDYNPYYE